MISYYFDGNNAFTHKVFEEAGITLSEEEYEYVEAIVQYLIYEYNTPFSDFIQDTSCEEILEAFEDNINAQDFVDSVLLHKTSTPSKNAVLF